MDTISTRQLAELLAVSEATVKRWADAGQIRCFRTPGGHRKFRMADVADFLREHQYEAAGPIGSAAGGTSPATGERPTGSTGDPGGSSSFGGAHSAANANASLIDREEVVRFRNMALAADVDGLVSLIAQYRIKGLTLSEIFDAVACAALVDIGERWARGVLTVAQEHMAASAVVEMLARLRPLIEKPGVDRGKVVLACPGGEQHDIAVRMASLLAQGLGFVPLLVGAQAPVRDLGLLIAAERPRVVVLSASEAANSGTVAQDLASLMESCHTAGSVVLVGGSGYARLTSLPPGATMIHSLQDLHAALQNVRP